MQFQSHDEDGAYKSCLSLRPFCFQFDRINLEKSKRWMESQENRQCFVSDLIVETFFLAIPIQHLKSSFYPDDVTVSD